MPTDTPNDKPAQAQTAPAGPVAAAAWMHPDGRIVPAETMLSARRSGGAPLTALKWYTIALYAGAAPVPAVPSDEYLESLLDDLGLPTISGYREIVRRWHARYGSQAPDVELPPEVLRQRAERAEADAARYRWLRDYENPLDDVLLKRDIYGQEWRHGESLDRAIDDAREADAIAAAAPDPAVAAFQPPAGRRREDMNDADRLGEIERREAGHEDDFFSQPFARADLLALIATARQALAYRALIDAHNAGCATSCEAEQAAGSLVSRCHQFVPRGQRCPECPRRRVFDVPAIDAQPKEPGA